RGALAEGLSLSANPLLVARRLDRRESRPLASIILLLGQELAAQEILLFSSESHDVTQAHISEADRVCRPVRMKIICSRGQQELGDGVEERFLLRSGRLS